MQNSPTRLTKSAICLGLIVQFLFQTSPILGWDAGTESRRHSEGTGGESSITIFDTRPYWAQSTGLTTSGRVADCPAGYTNTGLTCYRGPDTYGAPSRLADCPAGYTNMGLDCQKGANIFDRKAISSCPSGYFLGAAKRCYQNCRAGYTNNGETCGRGADSLGMSRMTCSGGEERVQISGGEIPRCYQRPVCKSGYEYWGLLCHIAAPGVKRTAVSTVTMDVKQSGNTHLWIVNRALDLLKRSDDATARDFAAMMDNPTNRTAWENGLWDGDATAHADYPENMGTHFYNAAKKDWKGNATDLDTYNIAKGSILPIVLGIGGAVVLGPASLAAGAAAGAVGSTVGSDEIGKAMFKNKKSCKNSRECAKEQITNASAGWNATNAYALGLALHYMTDATQPMHTSGYDGFKIPNNLHPQYEYYAPFVQGQFPSSSMTWDKRWASLDADQVFYQTALKSNTFAPRLSNALHMAGDAGIVTIQGFNGIGPYTGYNIYNDKQIDAVTGEILRDAYQSTASYLYAVAKTMGTKAVSGGSPGEDVYDVATFRNMQGKWIGYFPDGTKSAYVWSITQTGGILTMVDVGAGTNARSKGRIAGNRVYADDFGTVGTLSGDGKTITWTDNTKWVRP